MRFLIVLFFPFFVGAAVPVVDGVKLGKEEVIKDVRVLSAEKDDSIFYHASYQTAISGDYEKALQFVLNFPQRCNNSYRRERKLTSKENECVYHNDNLIESQIVRELKTKDKEQFEVDRFVLKRRIWNKGLHTYNDLVTVKELKPESNQERLVEISYRLLHDEEANKLIDNPVPFDNAFYYTVGTYRMGKQKDGKISIKYSYVTKTDHWFLTSGMVQGSIYSSLANGARYAVDGISGAINRGSN